MKITSYTVRNYQFTLVVAVMTAVIGVVTMLTMPRSEDAEMHPPSFLITAVYPGTNSKDMEELVVKPIEKKIYHLDDVDKLISTLPNAQPVPQINFKYNTHRPIKTQHVPTII